MKKSASCKKDIWAWQKLTFKRGDEEIKLLKRKLKDLMSQQGQSNLGEEIKAVQKNINELWKREELYWSQWSRLKWLDGGDRNTKFFHASTLQRRGRNRLHRIKNKSGIWVEGKEKIFEAIVDNFEDVYKSDPASDLAFIGEVIPSLVSAQMNEMLLAPVTESEIKEAAFSNRAHKALGPDGLNGLFYQKNWAGVKDDICKAVWGFFNRGDIPAELNETIVALAPKVPLPESISQLRPIK